MAKAKTKEPARYIKQRVGDKSPAFYTLYFPAIDKTLGFRFSRENIKLVIDTIDKLQPIGLWGYTASAKDARDFFPASLLAYLRYGNLSSNPMVPYDEFVSMQDTIPEQLCLDFNLEGDESLL